MNLTAILHDLVMNFHKLMVQNKAKYFTIEGFGDTPFWYITDVRSDGTYPCHPTDLEGNPSKPRYVDYKTNVVIHYED